MLFTTSQPAISISAFLVIMMLHRFGKGLPIESKVFRPIRMVFPVVSFLKKAKSAGRCQGSPLSLPIKRLLSIATTIDKRISLCLNKVKYRNILQLFICQCHSFLRHLRPLEKAILEKLGVTFVTASPDIDEARHDGETPYDLVLRLAVAKARQVAKSHSGLIIASDQVATFGLGSDKADEILTKPLTHENAFKQLKQSSGRTVTFLTSITLLILKQINLQNHVEFFQVFFKTLSDNQIHSYTCKKKIVLELRWQFQIRGPWYCIV